MRVLFVGSAHSVHTPRWLDQLADTGWELHLFDPANRLVHPDLRHVTLHTGWKKPVPAGLEVRWRWPFARGRHLMARRLPWLWRRILPASGLRLARLIDELRPDCVHTLGLQHYGECMLEARDVHGAPQKLPWIYSCRGSDIYFYRHDPERERVIRGVLAACDFYLCNCQRDLRLAEEYGLKGKHLGYFQASGGFPIDAMGTLRQPGPTSQRRIVTVKGLHNETGRALTALEALRICAESLRGYTIKIFHVNSDEMRRAIREFVDSTGLEVEIVPRCSQRDIWELLGRSRINLAVSRSDGIPNTMIESMIMGAFPIQTNPGNATAEWIEDGVNGQLIPWDDAGAISAAVDRALEDDRLVDRAAARNAVLTRERLEESRVRRQIRAVYQRVVGGVGKS